MDNFTTLWNRLLLRSSALEPALAQDWVRDSFNQLAERREWSWLMKSGAFFPSVFDQTGTISIIPGSAVVTGVGTNFLPTYLGSQFRPAQSYPTYTIRQVASATQLVLDRPWVGPSLTASQFQIFQCYFPVPSDFQYFVSLINPTSNYRLWTNLTQAELDLVDPQRTQSGEAYSAAFLDYSSQPSGSVQPVLRISGTGAIPISTTTTGYTYPVNSTYVLQIFIGGDSGVAEFTWRVDSGETQGPVVTSPDPIDLSNGVQVYFPSGVGYAQGNWFIIQAFADAIPGTPRYELWPRPINTPFVYPYQYRATIPALTDDSPNLPPPIARRGDVLLEMCLERLALWPGTSVAPNPYYSIPTSRVHKVAAETLIYEIEKKDDDTAIKDLSYQTLPFYPAPWVDGGWLQSHALGPF